MISNKEFAKFVMNIDKTEEVEVIEQIEEEAKMFNTTAIKMYRDVQDEANHNPEELVKAHRRKGK